jgi:hypothetical protein
MKNKNQPRNICDNNGTVCQQCSVNGKLMCRFDIKDTIYFLIPVLAVWITWIWGLAFGFISGDVTIFQLIFLFSLYIGYLVFFFQIWENKILCSHCPYYAFKDEKTVKCYANYGLYKAWKYNPAPMSRSEQIQFIIGILIFTAIPLISLLLLGLYLYFGISLGLSIIWIVSMHFLSCSKCPNFSCPLNGVPKNIVDEYLKHNPIMRKAWEEKGYNID